VTVYVQVYGARKETIDGHTYVEGLVSNELAEFYSVAIGEPGDYVWNADFDKYEDALKWAQLIVKVNGFELHDATYSDKPKEPVMAKSPACPNCGNTESFSVERSVAHEVNWNEYRGEFEQGKPCDQFPSTFIDDDTVVTCGNCEWEGKVEDLKKPMVKHRVMMTIETEDDDINWERFEWSKFLTDETDGTVKVEVERVTDIS
jgi:hypothetical protein